MALVLNRSESNSSCGSRITVSQTRSTGFSWVTSTSTDHSMTETGREATSKIYWSSMTLLGTLAWQNCHKGRAYAWSNMQADPLLEQLDGFFTSVNWTLSYPSTQVLPLAKITSDHVPCKVMIDTRIPKSNLFRFENFWTGRGGFFDTVMNSWSQQVPHTDSAQVIAHKFKKLRHSTKAWSKDLSNLRVLIGNCNTVIYFLDMLEDLRGLSNPEANLRNLIKKQLPTLCTTEMHTGRSVIL